MLGALALFGRRLPDKAETSLLHKIFQIFFFLLAVTSVSKKRKVGTLMKNLDHLNSQLRLFKGKAKMRRFALEKLKSLLRATLMGFDPP